MRGRRCPDTLEHGLGDRVLVEVPHGVISLRVMPAARRRASAQARRDQCANRLALDRPRIPVRVLQRRDRRPGRCRSRACRSRCSDAGTAELPRQVVTGRARRRRTPSACAIARHRLGRGWRVVGDGVRQDDGVRFRVRQIERAAEHVAELVMQRHADGAEADAAEPGAIERVGARGAVVRPDRDDRRQRARQRARCLPAPSAISTDCGPARRAPRPHARWR